MRNQRLLFAEVLFSTALFSCMSGSTGNNHNTKTSVDIGCPEKNDADSDYTPESDAYEISGSGKNLQVIVSSIVKGDKKQLASLCIYPIRRTYPLHDIENGKQMEAYFDVMFDKTFRKRMESITANDWDNAGWRGYTVGSGELWVYDSLYAVNYSSPEEQRMLRARVQTDLKSINASLRGKGWKPYSCYKDCTDGSVIRIDVKGDDERDYRLAKYGKGRKPSDMPDVLMYGTVSINGSMSYCYHEFCNEQGDSISFGDIFYDAGDDGTIEMDWKDGRMTEHHRIRKCYWLDEMAGVSGR